jgi:pimeloyl-ACP methyl ester carboxylesterase
VRRRTLLLALAAKGLWTAGLVLLNRSLELDDLPPTLPGRMLDWDWRHGRVRYTTLGEGPPLVLLHGVHAAASSFEMRKIFEPLADRFTVYAPDLLGFGKSDRPPLEYSGELYADLVTDFLDQAVGGPCAIVASSLSSAYAVAAAVRRPTLVNRLVFICPTGAARATRSDALAETLYWFLRLPIQGRAAFNALVSRPSIRSYLRRQAYFDPSHATEQVVEQNWATAHQPNARFAPAAFLGGRLDFPLRPYFVRLSQPTLLVWGEDARCPPVSEGRSLEALNARSTLHVVERCGMLPHDERADHFLGLVRPFLAAGVPGGGGGGGGGGG